MSRSSLLCLAALTLGAPLLSGCDELAAPLTSGLSAPDAAFSQHDFELDICRRRLEEARQAPALPSAPEYDERRAAILGRAVGEPAVFTSTPSPFPEPRDGKHPNAWVQRLEGRHRLDKAALRAAVLRDGYVFSEDPMEAFALVRELTLPDLFDEPTIVLQRGDALHELKREGGPRASRASYVFTAGPYEGFDAKLLFADRVAVTAEAFGPSKHRDVRSLRDRVGFDRIRIERHTADAMVAALRFPASLAEGGRDEARWVTALVEADGPRLELACLDAPRARRAAIAEAVQADGPRRRSIAALQDAVRRLSYEKPPFDRPRGVKDHLSDGQLRPLWEFAYRRGHHGFEHEEKAYLVFDRKGRPYPPQMCVSFILDAYERASGTWYGTVDEPRERSAGTIDFNELGVTNRAGVLAFEQFAESRPDLFVTSRFEERIPFAQRDDYFAYLVAQADRFQPGDVVSIQGPKPDGYVHQHAILVEDTDPVTGMPHSLADQMKWPRLRTWEGIMAEAPKRALLYHVRPKTSFLTRLDRGERGAPGQTQMAARTL